MRALRCRGWINLLHAGASDRCYGKFIRRYGAYLLWSFVSLIWGILFWIRFIMRDKAMRNSSHPRMNSCRCLIINCLPIAQLANLFYPSILGIRLQYFRRWTWRNLIWHVTFVVCYLYISLVWLLDHKWLSYRREFVVIQIGITQPIWSLFDDTRWFLAHQNRVNSLWAWQFHALFPFFWYDLKFVLNRL